MAEEAVLDGIQIHPISFVMTERTFCLYLYPVKRALAKFDSQTGCDFKNREIPEFLCPHEVSPRFFHLLRKGGAGSPDSQFLTGDMAKKNHL